MKCLLTVAVYVETADELYPALSTPGSVMDELRDFCSQHLAEQMADECGHQEFILSAEPVYRDASPIIGYTFETFEEQRSQERKRFSRPSRKFMAGKPGSNWR